MIPDELKEIPDLKVFSEEETKWGFIYFILLKGKIIYVGQTQGKISVRLSSFKKEKKTEYDEVYYIVRQAKDLDITESYYIGKFNPQYNIRGNKEKKKTEIKHQDADIILRPQNWNKK